ncbi:MAG: hypothetical protein ACR2N3_19215 [Pyrinomonadaceae bacterium]
MKAVNSFFIVVGVLWLAIRCTIGLSNDEMSNYGSEITFFDLFFFRWGLFALLVTTALLLFVNIFNKIVKEGRYVKNDKYTLWMFIALSLTTSFSFTFLYSENFDAILNSGWIGLFDFPFFMSSVFLLVFRILMPMLKKIIGEKESMK